MSRPQHLIGDPNSKAKKSLFRFFKITKKPKAPTQASSWSIPSASTELPNKPAPPPPPPKPKNNFVPNGNTSVHSGVQPNRNGQLSKDIFPKNVSKPTIDIPLPRIGDRIEDTRQLALCVSLLTKASSSTLHRLDTEMEWIQEMENHPLEKQDLDRLMMQMINRFIQHPSKDSEVIREIALLGPILDKEYYRKLLNCFLKEFISDTLLNINLLQGLVQLVEDASPGFVLADDLTQILRTIRTRLQDPAQKLDEYLVHLTIAISKVLNAMVDDKVTGLDRVQEHEPLFKLLSDLRRRDDPFLKFQALYSFQALQWVPNDETPLQCGLRHFVGVVDGLIKISGIVQLDFRGFLGGLQDIQKAVAATYSVAKSGWEDVPALIQNGKGVFDSVKEGLGSGHKHPWYISLRGAEALVRKGQLANFNALVCEAPCRRDLLFQWGICQLLGEIAIESSWDKSTRSRAVSFLGGLYMSMVSSKQHLDVRRWILTILVHVSDLSDTGTSISPLTDIEAVKAQARALIEDLEEYGDRAIPFPHSMKSRLPLPRSSTLLKEVNDRPDLDLTLDRLRRQRWREYDRRAVYIESLSKTNLQASDDNLVPLRKRVDDYLESKAEVMLILGDSGAGKSTFNMRLEHSLWENYTTGAPIPLFIDLKAVQNPTKDLVQQHLDDCSLFSTRQIEELKRTQQFILICDGYDECRTWSNLHTTNRFNQPYQWKVKMIITCRTQYLSPHYRSYFEPQAVSKTRYSNVPDLYDEAVIVPFKMEQIQEYVNQYAVSSDVQGYFVDQPVWTSKRYMERLTGIAHLMDLITNPFMLRMVLDTLPRIAVSTTRLSRADLYDEFVEFHFENEQRRLIEQRSSGKLEPENSAAFGLVKGEDFILLGIDFSKRLSEAIYKELDGVNSVDYSIVTDEGTWKTQFFGPEARVKLLRESSQLVSRASNKDSSLLRNKNNLIRKKNSYEFSHRSILEYFYSCLIFDPRRNPPRFDLSVCLASTSNPSPLLRHPLGQQSLLPEPSIIDFLAERVRQRASFKDQLLEILWLSKRDVSVSVAAANAMTILVRAGVHFNGADLKRIQIPGSDLSRGQFDSAQFQGANLSGANFSKAWLRQADFSKTNMDGVFFGEMPYLEIPTCNHSTVSHDGSMIAFVVRNDIRIYDTSSRTQRLTLSGHKSRVFGLTFSTNSLCIASAGEDMTARVWYLQQLDEQGSLCSVILEGHSSRVEIVCFSPDALQLASYSFDNTIRVWDIELRTAIFILEGDTSRSISCLAWSPDGECILSSSFREGTLWMWKAKSGEMSRVWEKVLPSVLEVGYSAPDGRYLIVCLHKIVCIWDVQQDCRGYGDGHKWTKPIITLRGHTATVTKAAFSPNGQWIATSSSDRSVRLWEARTGALVSVMNGHSHEVENVAFLNDQMIISCGKDRTTRFWQLSNSIEIDQKEAAYEGTRQRKCHTGPVTSVAFSPHGKSILSCSSDGTIRLWDSETGDTDILVEAPEKNFSNVAWSFDGQQIAAGCSSSVMQYDLIDIGDNNGEDIQKKALTVKEGVARKVEAAAYSQCGAYSRCGRWFATGGHHGKVCLFDLTLLRSRTVTGQANEGQTLTGHANSRVTKVVFSADGHRLASITDDQDFFIWGTRTGTALKKVVKGTAQAFTFAPSGPEFAVTSGIVITLWDGVESTRSADELWTHKSNALCVAWSPCGQWIVSGDGVAVYLWKKNQSATVNTTNQTKGERGSRTAKDKWTLVKIVSDFAGSVNSVDWHPRAGLSGNALDFVTGSKDHSVGVWRIVTASDGADKVRVELVWGSLPGRLVSSGTKITDAVDLSSTQRTMLRQRQAIDESPLILTDKEP